MPRGGARPGAGRKPGAMTKAKLDMVALARDHAKEAFNILMGIARNERAPADARKGAAIAVLDRAFGRPAQALTVKPTDETPAEFEQTFDLSKMSAEELAAYEKLALAAEGDEPEDEEND